MSGFYVLCISLVCYKRQTNNFNELILLYIQVNYYYVNLNYRIR